MIDRPRAKRTLSLASILCVSMVWGWCAAEVLADEQRPLFEPRVSEREYLGEREIWLGPRHQRPIRDFRRRPLYQWVEGDVPSAGMRVYSFLKPDSAGKDAGVRRGDLIVELDGRPVEINDFQRDFPVVDAGAELKVWREATGYHTVRLRAGNPGLWVKPQCYYIRWYYQHGLSDPRWDGTMLVGMAAADTDDWEMAETAFAHAMAQGYPADTLMKAMAFHARMSRGDWAGAGSLLSDLGRVSSDQPWLPSAREQFNAARAVGDGEAMVRLVRDSPKAFADADSFDYVTWLALHKALGEGDPPGKGSEPADLAKQMTRRSLLDRCEPGKRWVYGKNSQSLNEKVIADEMFESSPRPGYFRQAYLHSQDPVGDFGLIAEVQFKPNGEMHPNYFNAIMLGIVNYAEPNSDGPNREDYWQGRLHILAAKILHKTSESYRFEVRSHNQVGSHDVTAPWLAWSWKNRHTLEFYRVGSRGQILIDGQTVYNLPVDPELNDLALHLHIVGFATRFHRLEWFALESD
ncbi:MAG: hypothetical protein AAF086_04050 [Planctomycetota bacterium]